MLTISAQRLRPAYLQAAGVDPRRAADVVVEGVDPAGELATAILGNRPHMNLQQAASEVVPAAVRPRQRAPAVRTLVLECTNLPSYAARIEAAAGLRTVSPLQCETLLRPFGA